MSYGRCDAVRFFVVVRPFCAYGTDFCATTLLNLGRHEVCVGAGVRFSVVLFDRAAI